GIRDRNVTGVQTCALPISLKLIQQLHLKSILDTMQEEVEKELEYYHTLENQLIKMRKIRHDFNNQLQTAYMLLDDPNMETASFQIGRASCRERGEKSMTRV